MAIATDTDCVSKVVKTVKQAFVLNAAYLTRGATKIDEAQMSGKRSGTKYGFAVDTIKAAEFDGTNALSDSITTSTVELEVKTYGSKIACGRLDKALNLGDWADLSIDVGAQIANKAAEAVAIADMGKVAHGNVVIASNYKGIAQASAKLAATHQGKVYGFADPFVVGALQGDGRNAQPINVGENWQVGLEGKLFNISELRTMNLPSIKALNGTNVIGTNDLAVGYKTVNDVKKYVIQVGTNGLSTCSLDGEYSAIILRTENAQAIGDAGENLDVGADGSKSSADGITVAMNRVSGADFKADYYWAVGIAGGLVDPKKAMVVLMKNDNA